MDLSSQPSLALTLLPLALAALLASRHPFAGLRVAAHACFAAAAAGIIVAALTPLPGTARALLFAFVVAAVIAAAVLAFSARYMAGETTATAYARDAIALVACLLLTSITEQLWLFGAAWVGASLLVARMLGRHAAGAHAARAATRARRTFLPADALLLVALVALAAASGATDFAALASWLHNVEHASLLVYVAAFAVVAAIAARAAALPCHRWLLASVSAPTPLCALLHAGFVNAGAITVVKLAPLFALVPAALATLFAIGAVAMIGGNLLAQVRGDVKGRLAASTVAQMGYMLMQCGLGALGHALVHLAAHAAFKADAFLRAGSLVAAPRVPRPVPPVLAGWLLFSPVVVFVVLGSVGGLDVADTLLATFATSLLVEAVLSAWRYGGSATLLRASAPAIIVAGTALALVHGWLGAFDAPLHAAASPATTHLAAVVVAVLSVLAFARHGGLVLPADLYGRILRLAHGVRHRARTFPTLTGARA